MFNKDKYLYGNLDKKLYKDIKKEILLLEIVRKQKLVLLKKLKKRLIENN